MAIQIMRTPTKTKPKSKVNPTKQPVDKTEPCEPTCDCDCVEEHMFTPIEPLKKLLRKRDTLQSLYTGMQHTMSKVSLELRLIQVKIEAESSMLQQEIYNPQSNCVGTACR